MNRKAVLACAFILVAPLAAIADGSAGRSAYGRGDYAAAHAELLSEARRGDAQAQELLGLMYALGPQVYPGVPQDLSAAAHLLARAARAGRPAAASLHCALVRRGTLHWPQTAACFPGTSAAALDALSRR